MACTMGCCTGIVFPITDLCEAVRGIPRVLAICWIRTDLWCDSRARGENYGADTTRRQVEVYLEIRGARTGTYCMFMACYVLTTSAIHC